MTFKGLLKKLAGAEIKLPVEVFDAGARSLFVKIDDNPNREKPGIWIRARNRPARFIPWAKIYDVAQEIAADTYAGPRKGPLVRGGF